MGTRRAAVRAFLIALLIVCLVCAIIQRQWEVVKKWLESTAALAWESAGLPKGWPW